MTDYPAWIAESRARRSRNLWPGVLRRAEPQRKGVPDVAIECI